MEKNLTKILSAKIQDFDPDNEGIITIGYILEDGRVGELEMGSGVGNPSKRILDYFGLDLEDYHNDAPICEDSEKPVLCSESRSFTDGFFETDIDLHMAESMCYMVNRIAAVGNEGNPVAWLIGQLGHA